MTGISIKAELRDEAARHDLQDLLGRMEMMRPFYDAVGNTLVASTGDRFKAEVDPEGRPWQSLKPSTIKARTRKGQLPLTILRSNSRGKSGSSLAGSINYRASDDEVRVGSPVTYAAIHQLGGTIKRKARKGKIYRQKDDAGNVGNRFVPKNKANHVTEVDIPAYSINIPARPFLGVSRDDQEDILGMARDYFRF
nr:phage virion morphogenesis protein [uncultured Celeribacter sp.]